MSIRDVTALKKLAKAEDDNKVMQLLTASVSHELVTPLKCIGSFAKELIGLISNKKLRYKVELISSTSKMLLSQIKVD